MKLFFSTMVCFFCLAIFSCKSENSVNTDTTDKANNESALTTGANAQTTSNNAQANPNQVTQAAGPLTTIELSTPTYKFGKVTDGEIVKTTVKVKNTGTEPLVISNCSASCGCTTPKCPNEPVAPGQSTDVEVSFDSKGKVGKVKKDVTITANTNPAQHIFSLEGEVLAKK